MPASLPGYARCFAGWSGRWGGAVASIIEVEVGTCFGSIVHLPDAELRLLDGFEGVASSDPFSSSGVYRRQGVECVLEDGTAQRAIAYIKNNL